MLRQEFVDAVCGQRTVTVAAPRLTSITMSCDAVDVGAASNGNGTNSADGRIIGSRTNVVVLPASCVATQRRSRFAFNR